MNELIKVDYTHDRPAVSARELHEFLEVGAQYSHWFERMCEYGFSEGVDYQPFLANRSDGLPGKPRQDAAVTIDMAKEICMLQRNEKGKIARQYFLQLEKDWNSPEKIMARALQIADRKIKALEMENAAQKQVIAEFEPIRQYVDEILSSPGTLATSQIAADYGMSARNLNRILHEEGIQRSVNGQWILYTKYMNQGYTKSKTIQITRSDGRPDTVLHTEWTQKGRIMIHELLQKRGITALMDRQQSA